MAEQDLVQQVKSLFMKTGESLWRAKDPRYEGPGPLFPKIGEELRVSEQEARFHLTAQVDLSGWAAYSVETPTEKLYQEKGSTPIRARSDVTLYERGRGEPLINIEFKAHTVRYEDIRKDIAKLVREPRPGAWFHLLDTAHDKTYAVLLRHFRRALDSLKDEFRNERHAIAFAICVLGPRKLYHVVFDPRNGEVVAQLDALFGPGGFPRAPWEEAQLA